MRWLESFLKSGHTFDVSEYELKSKFILLNSMILVTFFSIWSLTIILFLNNEIKFALVNCVYLLIGLFSIFFLKKSKENHRKVIYFIPIFSIPLIVTAIVYYPADQIRIAWFLVLVVASFFLGGKKFGISVLLVSILTIVALYFSTDVFSNYYTLVLSIVIVSLGAIVVNLYESREVLARKNLQKLNEGLELRIKKEIEKRTLIYEKSSNRLKKSAEKLKEQKNAYKELAYYDKLTGLPNRVLFNDRLKHAIAKSNRNNKKLAVIFLDLDNFKEINDSFGHFIGDKVLEEVAKRLKKRIRKSDTLTRFGGDEFVVLLEDFTDTSNLGEISQGFIGAISSPMHMHEQDLYMTTSIGISIYPDDGIDTDSLLKCADAAMYSAKKDGVNLVHFYKKEMTQKSLDRLTLENNIRQALKKDEFVVYYQPVIDTNMNRKVGLEALVRWQHPERGLLTPYYFIDVAESSALIIQLGEQVLKKVAKQLSLWHKKGFDPEFISVNLSVKQLRHRSLFPTLLEILRQTSFRSNWLELEITEGYTMQKPAEAIRLLRRIKKVGIGLSLDDFGTGYSSLSYLKKLPVNKLKIDKSFIDGTPKNREDNALVSAIVTMANSMNLEVVAEGVETKEQKDFLKKIKCYHMQGYYFAKPMSATDIEKYFNIKL